MMKFRGKAVALALVWVFLTACGGAQTSKTPDPSAAPGVGSPPSSGTDRTSTSSRKLMTAEQAVERAKVVMAAHKAARYEATHLDSWLPTNPTGTERTRAAWRVNLFDSQNRQTGWVVLDEETGDPLQVGDT